jgi:hypothetical protein
MKNLTSALPSSKCKLCGSEVIVVEKLNWCACSNDACAQSVHPPFVYKYDEWEKLNGKVKSDDK